MTVHLNYYIINKHQTFTGKYVRASTCKQKNDHRVDGDARAKEFFFHCEIR
jgi:hypothetical protein